MPINKENQPSIPSNIPDSLIHWTTDDASGGSRTFEAAARQVFDLMHLEGETKAYFKHLAGRWSPLDRYVGQADAYKELDSTEKVRAYMEAELLKNKDPYHMLGRNSMPGEGIRTFYDRLRLMVALDDLSDEERDEVKEIMGHWEQAVIDVVCDEDAYFTPTAIGNPGTISELFGSSVVFDAPLAKSPNLLEGKYREQLMSALDYEGIVQGRYSRADYSQFARQETILYWLHASQATGDKLDPDFWHAIEANENFVYFNRHVAVKEGYPHANDLLVRSLAYAWDKHEDGTVIYDFHASRQIDSHFEGKTAADQFLANPELRFTEVFRDSRSSVQEDFLWDYERIGETRNWVVLLDSELDDTTRNITYVVVGEGYEEKTLSIDETELYIDADESDELDEQKLIIKLAREFEVFKTNYLQRLESLT